MPVLTLEFRTKGSDMARGKTYARQGGRVTVRKAGGHLITLDCKGNIISVKTRKA